MKKRKVFNWRELKDDFTDKLLLGNGASIAVCESFKYKSLYEEACKSGVLDRKSRALFKHFKTTDFEYVLRLLSQTNKINTLLDIKEDYTFEFYKALRDTLIKTITDIHPAYEDVESSLPTIAEFMKQFNTVLSLNYDLLVYWAMLKGNDKYGQWFKDAFVDDGKFRNEFVSLYEPYEAEGATLVFYPHGNLIFATEIFGDEVKLTRAGEETYLLDKIISKWRRGNHIPLFVSEGDTAEKLRAIRRSNYLDTIYDYALEQPSNTLVIYGWAMRDDDTHVLRALIKSRPQKIAISVHEESEDVESYSQRVTYLISGMRRKLQKKHKYEIYFFNAESKGCWNNPS